MESQTFLSYNRERERERESGGGLLFFLFRSPLCLFSSPSSLLFSPCSFFLSGCLLLLVVDRDSDDGRAAPDYSDGREAPLELAVAHLVFFIFSFFFHFFFRERLSLRLLEVFRKTILSFSSLQNRSSRITYPLDVVHVLGVDVFGLLFNVFRFFFTAS